MALRNGLMAPFMKANGKIIGLMGKEGLSMLTVIFLKVSGKTIKQMDMGFISM
jgi:hypothetical protein